MMEVVRFLYWTNYYVSICMLCLYCEYEVYSIMIKVNKFNEKNVNICTDRFSIICFRGISAHGRIYHMECFCLRLHIPFGI